MWRKRTFLIAILSAISLCSFHDIVLAEASHFEHKEFGVSFSIPAGWSQDYLMSLFGKNRLVVLHHKNARISLQYVDSPRSDINLLDYAQFQESWLGKSMGAKVITKTKQVSINGKEAAMTLFEADARGLPVKVLQYYFFDPRRRKIYHLTLHSPEGDDYEANQSDLHMLLDTFTIQ